MYVNGIYIYMRYVLHLFIYIYIYIMYLWSLDGYIALNSLIIVASAATHKMEKGKSQHVDGSIAKWLAKGLEGVPTHDTGWSRIQPSKPSGASWPAEPYPMSTQRLGTASCIRGMPWPQRLARLVPKMPAYIYIYIYLVNEICNDLPHVMPINIFHEPMPNSSKLVIFIFTKFTVFSRSSLTFSRSIHFISRL